MIVLYECLLHGTKAIWCQVKQAEGKEIVWKWYYLQMILTVSRKLKTKVFTLPQVWLFVWLLLYIAFMFIISTELHFNSIFRHNWWYYVSCWGIGSGVHNVTHSMSVYLLFQLLNKMTDFRKIWYEYYVIGAHFNILHFNFLQLVIILCQMCKLEFWTTWAPVNLGSWGDVW